MALLTELAEERLQANLVLCNGVLSSCEKACRWQQLLDILEKMDGNLVSYTAAITACQRSRQATWALRLLKLMEHKGLKPNAITCAAAVACGKDTLRLLRQTEQILFALLEKSSARFRGVAVDL